MREYKLFRCSKKYPIGENSEWKLNTESSNFEYISNVMKLNAEDKELQDFEWKLVTSMDNSGFQTRFEMIEAYNELKQENEHLKKVYKVTNDDWKRLHMALTKIDNAHFDAKVTDDEFIKIVGQVLKETKLN